MKKRNSQDSPAAGLRWIMPFQAGENPLRVVAKKGAAEVTDEIRFCYATEKWGKPAKVVLAAKGTQIEARLVDAEGRQCLDARNVIRFRIAGDGELVCNLGTAGGSRKVELANGLATIAAKLKKGEAVVTAAVEGLPTAFLNIRA